jgi:CO dehydrogenase maturation factor
VRVAVAGKGGAGKTTIAATMARLEARRGEPVVAVDGDPNPNLAAALGVHPRAAAAAAFLPASLVSRRLQGPALVLPVEEAVDRHALAAPDGVRLLLMGMPAHAEEGCLCAAHATVSALLGDLGTQPGTLTVVDMEASPEHLSRGTTRHVDALLLVTEPYFRSLETVGRLAALAGELPIPRVAVVANKVRSPIESDAIAAFCDRHGLDLLDQVPWSEEVIEADLTGMPLLDVAPVSPAVAAIAHLTTRLRQ